jgi:hypothetical protein
VLHNKFDFVKVTGVNFSLTFLMLAVHLRPLTNRCDDDDDEEETINFKEPNHHPRE